MLRDILRNKSQFITIFCMVVIGVMVYAGIEAYMDGMTDTADRFYTENNLQDLNVMGYSFDDSDIDKIKNISYVKDAEGKLVFNATSVDDDDKSYLVSVIGENNISEFYVEEGVGFDKDKSGVWLDYFYALENDIKVSDKISFKYDGYVFEEEVLGLIYVPDHLYDVKDESQIMPNRNTYGFLYMSILELEGFIKKSAIDEASKSLGVSLDNDTFDRLNPEFNYLDYVSYNYIMVDVKNKKYNDKVRDKIESDIDKAIAIVDIEDTSSYAMYQGEIDEGEAYVGIFSGLFLFIAMLSVITTMTRVVKKQKLQIGTLKALGFSNFRITLHYVGYGFFVAVMGSVVGILLGRFFLGKVFLDLELSFFEVPNGRVFIKPMTYVMGVLVVVVVSLITYFTCRKELKKKPAESLRNELPKVRNGSLNITTKGIFKRFSFSTKWNIRDILRNKFRSVTGVVGIVGCCTLIVCALGMLNSMNYFIKLQFDDLYNFDYKLSLNEGISESTYEELISSYGDNTSESLAIELKLGDGSREANTIFVDDSNNYVRFVNKSYDFIKLKSDKGVYVTYKFLDKYGLEIGDTVKWHIYGSKDYYESKIVGCYRDPQVQGLSATREYIESLGIEYKADSLYTNVDLSDTKDIDGVSVVQDIEELKDAIESMLSMMREMIIIIIVFAVLLGVIIIYNMGILSYSEKTYQFATLKVLGFSNKRIRKIFVEQNNWICVVSIIIGLPVGYYLLEYLFIACLDENYDFGVYVELWTYVMASVGTYLVSYLVSRYLSRKVNSIDMVSSLKGNE